MKKALLTVIAVAFALNGSAQLSTTRAIWAKLLDTTSPDMGITLKKTDNALFYLSSVGSCVGDGGTGFSNDYDDPTCSIYYDGVIVGHGAAYAGSGYNNNLSILKTDLDGTLEWSVCSTNADIFSNNGGLVPTADGGVVAAVVVRHTDNLRTQPLSITDALGVVHTVDWTLAADNAPRHFEGLLLKTDADGGIEWLRRITVSAEPQPEASSDNAENTGTAFYISSLIGADNGGFYMAGRYVNPVTFVNVDGSTRTLTPHNTAGWNGDPQNSRGDIFVAHFNADGLLIDVLTTTGVAWLETSPVIAHIGSDIVLNFLATGTGEPNSAIALNGTTIDLPSDQQAIITARMTADFDVKWVRCFRGEMIQNRNAVFQSNQVSVVDTTLWLTGMGNYMLTDDSGVNTISTLYGNIREGYIIKCSANTGQWLAANSSKTAFPQINGIVGYMGGFESADGKLFTTYGYTFGGQGILLSAYDATTLAPVEVATLIAGGSQPTAQDCVADGTTLYTISRGRDQGIDSQVLRPIGAEFDVPATMHWAALFCSFELPFSVKPEGASDSTEPHYGDISGDGYIDVTDVNLILNMMLGTLPQTVEADSNGDGQVDVVDLNALINAMLTE